MTDWSLIVSDAELAKAAKERAKQTKKVGDQKVPKKFNDIFENDMWLILYKMGFKQMNATNQFKIEIPGNSKQIDIVAMDDETCILVECKASETYEKDCSFKKELESIHGYYADVCAAITEKYGTKKFRFIFATKNYLLGQADLARISGFNLFHMDQDAVDYYQNLVGHLNSAARYQFLGNLFSDTEVDGLESRVSAIRGQMAGRTYYSFLIEPERLLKLAYVLHRNKANYLLMPTYQRIIKKDRLRSVREFVNNGGFFPNSLIVSVNSSESLEFEPASGGEIGLANIGILTLPKKYRSVYVIDGQHRLYGYSDSATASTSVIPVVAFIDLPLEEQVKMFMDINENQKRVSKSLRNTLNIDLLWKANNPKQRTEALMLKLAEALGEDHQSPLYGRVVTGEDTPNAMRCITTDFIKKAFERSAFFNEYTKTGSIKRHGTFDQDNNDASMDLMLAFLKKCLGLISTMCKQEWQLGSEGFLTINNTAYALVKVLDDIVNLQLAKEGLQSVASIDTLYASIEPMLLDLCDSIDTLPAEDRNRIRKAKGDAAKKETWRILQVALHKTNSEFINDDLQAYIDDYCTDNNPQSEEYILSIESELKKRFRGIMEQTANWEHSLLPQTLAQELTGKLASENFRRSGQGMTSIGFWDIISFEELELICKHSSNWSTFAAALLQRPQGVNKTTAIGLLRSLATYRNKIKGGKSIIRSEFEDLQSIYNDFCTTENE